MISSARILITELRKGMKIPNIHFVKHSKNGTQKKIKINTSSNFLRPCPEPEKKGKFEGHNSFYNNWAN